MQLGMIGLGRMGANMARRLLRGGHQVVTYDRTPAAVQSKASDIGLSLKPTNQRPYGKAK